MERNLTRFAKAQEIAALYFRSFHYAPVICGPGPYGTGEYLGF